MDGSLIAGALQLIKEKERQGDKAMDRLAEQYRQQTYERTNADWTGTRHTQRTAPPVYGTGAAKSNNNAKSNDDEKPKDKSETSPSAEEQEPVSKKTAPTVAAPPLIENKTVEKPTELDTTYLSRMAKESGGSDATSSQPLAALGGGDNDGILSFVNKYMYS